MRRQLNIKNIKFFMTNITGKDLLVDAPRSMLHDRTLNGHLNISIEFSLKIKMSVFMMSCSLKNKSLFKFVAIEGNFRVSRITPIQHIYGLLK